MLVVFGGGGGVLQRTRFPTSFLPDEDQGYLFLHLQLPNAASLERTEERAQKDRGDSREHARACKYTTTVAGFSLLSFVRTTYNGFFFVTLKDWDERKSRQEQYQEILQHVNRELAKLPDGFALSFPPPAIPGVGTSGGFTFVLEDRAGKDVQFLADNLNKFMAAAQKRPEIARHGEHLPAQRAAAVHQRRSRQGAEAGRSAERCLSHHSDLHGRLVRELLQPLRPAVAGVCRGRGRLSHEPGSLGQFYVRNSKGEHGAAVGAGPSIEPRPGPEFTMRYNLYRSAQIIGERGARLQLAQAMKALEEMFAQTMPREMGYDYMGMSFQEKKAQAGRAVVR